MRSMSDAEMKNKQLGTEMLAMSNALGEVGTRLLREYNETRNETFLQAYRSLQEPKNILITEHDRLWEGTGDGFENTVRP